MLVLVFLVLKLLLFLFYAMNNNTVLQRVEEYKLLTPQEQYNKLLVYLYQIQKTEKNALGLALLVDELGVDQMPVELMVELYTLFLEIIELGNQQIVDRLDYYNQKLKKIQNDYQSLLEKDQIEADMLLSDL